MSQEVKEIISSNLLSDHGADRGGMLELNSKVLEQSIWKNMVAKFEMVDSEDKGEFHKMKSNGSRISIIIMSIKYTFKWWNYMTGKKSS